MLLVHSLCHWIINVAAACHEHYVEVQIAVMGTLVINHSNL